MYDVISSTWFSTASNLIGIVGVKTQFDGVKYYIGIGQGKDIKIDEQQIAGWGAKFDPAYIAEFTKPGRTLG